MVLSAETANSRSENSPLYYDQTRLFSPKKWRRILYTEAEIKADPNLKTRTVTNVK
jgi:acyl-homoserine-lactone acylase